MFSDRLGGQKYEIKVSGHLVPLEGSRAQSAVYLSPCSWSLPEIPGLPGFVGVSPQFTPLKSCEHQSSLESEETPGAAAASTRRCNGVVYNFMKFIGMALVNKIV